MSSMGELKQCNVQVIHFKINIQDNAESSDTCKTNVFDGGIVLPS